MITMYHFIHILNCILYDVYYVYYVRILIQNKNESLTKLSRQLDGDRCGKILGDCFVSTE